MIVFALAAALSTASPCAGFYSYLPTDRDAEVAFSVEVQPTALSILYLDYGRVFAERQNRPDGVIQIFDPGPGGVNYWLACGDRDAFLIVDHDAYHPTTRIYRLVRTQGDIWAEAAKRGWQTGD
ncbi:hypothetical protein [Croceicoccus sp. Ery15]|uniref:hypothetical protein n=1 Tax=Croceicoccus sp. Ery15 TaxID=1703338 RepID=UPI001E45D23F|nr:hypothetical protein [Croceicoccus sp. Ery15]